MNVDLGIWSRLTRVAAALLVLALLLFVAVWYYPLIKANERRRKENLRLDAQIQAEEAKSRQLRTSIEALSHDPKTIERVARETLGYARTGETVIRFEAPATNSPPAR